MENQTPTPLVSNPPQSTIPTSAPGSSLTSPVNSTSKFPHKIILLTIIILLITGGIIIYFFFISSKIDNTNLTLPKTQQSQPQEIEKGKVYEGIKKKLIETLQ